MPLYELILITKCSQPAVAVNILKSATSFICGQGGNVRELKILADRLLAKEMQSIDKQHSLIGRYNQILFDGPPSLMPLIEKEFRLDKNILKISFFKVKDFYSYAQEYSKPLQDTSIKQGSPKQDAARRIALLRAEGL